MGNIRRLFCFDMGRLKANVVSIIITVGLIIMPSLFAWYNIIACWNVFDNTGNLTVAVANTDEGYQSDLVPLRINVGDQVVSALRANDQIDWHITDEEDAVDGAKSGRYYAAVVIPKTFSRDMLTFYTGDSGHADIVYYANEKKSAIAPKITDQGADSVSYQVNAVFAETLSEVALSLAESISSFAEDDDWDGRIAVVADHVREMADSFDDAASVLTLYSSLAQSCENLSRNSAALAEKASGALDETLSAATTRSDAVPATVGALRDSADSLKSSLASSTAGFEAVSDSIDDLFDAASADSQGIAKDLRTQADALASHAKMYRDVADGLDGLAASLPDTVRPQVSALAGRARSVAAQADSMADSLRGAAAKLEQGDADVGAERDEAKAKAAEALASVKAISDEYEANVAPGLASLVDEASSMADSLSTVTTNLKGVGSELSASAGSAADVMAGTAEKIDGATAKLREVSSGLREMAKSIDEAVASGDRDALRAVLGSDVSALSRALAMPVGVERIPVFPVENFGSAMAPLYTTLALFIGSLLILVVFKPKVSRRIQEAAGLVNAKPRQLFFGRFAVMAVVSLAQTTVMALGNMFFLDVQVASPVLFMLCFWGAGLVFTFIIYALVVSFANLGKAIAVLLLIVQVTGCGGSFPLQIMPDFVQALSPWLPATHVVNAMRSAMMGTYGNDFWVQMGMLCLFLVPAALLGLVLRKPLAKFMEWYVEQVESSKLIS
ncbi:YhgE/Pip domain-containing protein [Adlercreutzia sp. R25]|uniref:YhgE/Pip domain-containing protein n=1 Tax=Adlercreutzia shanghongiae TaxID=3111773 RepID=A0ABU6IZQ3_9ACTN|nr:MULTISPECIES: YhgE/Pip domain-containing protein [unclassified Adlercreutzia]MEC4272299.1 YhgE/Pip domain-containing protein [Adlercreutzia sp. R25]MEC4295253.1 YhgE/Pip domain-containing protein [Adlercreutzia sp. R22]